jgi:hypothetical protein
MRGVRIATRLVKGCLQGLLPFASPVNGRPKLKLIGTENLVSVKVTDSFATFPGMAVMVVVIAFIDVRVLKQGPCQVTLHRCSAAPSGVKTIG